MADSLDRLYDARQLARSGHSDGPAILVGEQARHDALLAKANEEAAVADNALLPETRG
jgi:hypothetical protein